MMRKLSINYDDLEQFDINDKLPSHVVLSGSVPDYEELAFANIIIDPCQMRDKSAQFVLSEYECNILLHYIRTDSEHR